MSGRSSDSALLTRSAERFAARARSHRWSRLRRVVLVLACTAALAIAGWLLFFSSVFAVHSVSVTGVGTFSSTAVRTSAESVMGEPLARLDTDALQKEIAAIPAVARVDVSRAWPRSVHVVVVERRPVAAVHGVSGWQLVDRHGVAFATVPHKPEGLVSLVVAAPAQSDPATRSALAVIRALPHRVMRHLREVSAQSEDGVRLRLKHGITVVWGGPDGSRRKGAALAALLDRPAAVYDVSTPGLVTTRS